MRLLIKLARTIEEDGVVLRYLPEERHLIRDGKDFSTKVGKIPKEKLVLGKFTHEKDTYVILELSEFEKITAFKRGAQVITAKDAGIIISKTGINKNSKVLDAGAGSGSLSAHLSLICDVTAIEKLDAHYEIAKKNLEGRNVNLMQGDIYTIDLNEQFDVFTLDVPEPWKALETAQKHLKIGGYLVVYSPQITQSQKTIMNLPENFLHQETIEIIERSWKITDKIVRPQTKDFQHTAFLSFIRKAY
jgi:tRNA (adenine57-N1/adenine58-N1)-methyltransferase catalytic subunit